MHSGMSAGLRGREQLGIEVAFVEEAKGSSAMHRCVAGCLNPTTTTDAECLADPNRPLVHAAFEVWKDYVAWDDYADAALLPDRFLQPYDAFEGLFVRLSTETSQQWKRKKMLETHLPTL